MALGPIRGVSWVVCTAFSGVRTLKCASVYYLSPHSYPSTAPWRQCSTVGETVCSPGHSLTLELANHSIYWFQSRENYVTSIYILPQSMHIKTVSFNLSDSHLTYYVYKCVTSWLCNASPHSQIKTVITRWKWVWLDVWWVWSLGLFADADLAAEWGELGKKAATLCHLRLGKVD